MEHRPKYLDPALAACSDEEVAALDRQNREEWERAGDDGPADLYRIQVQAELAWRQGRNPDRRVPLLLVTVGAQPDSPTHACLAWRAPVIVLLHTKDEEKGARTTRERLEGSGAEVKLAHIGSGGDLPRLYQEMHKAWREHGAPSGCAVDITGGLKTMSAGAFAAAFSLPNAKVSYVDTDQVKVGTTKPRTLWFRTRSVLLADPLTVFGVVERERAGLLFQQGAYAAATEAYRALSERVGQRTDGWRYQISRALAEVDAMRIGEAKARLEQVITLVERDLRQEPNLENDPWATPEARAWLLERCEGLRRVSGSIDTLGKGDPLVQREALKADGFLDFIAMFLSLARRRADDGAYDLAALYAYRAIEAVPQRRLVKLGFDPGDMDWERLFAEASTDRGVPQDTLQEALRKAAGGDGAIRKKVDRNFGYAVLSAVLNDKLVTGLRLDRVSGVSDARNKSLLAHGVSALEQKDAESLWKLASELFDRLCKLEGTSAAGVLNRHAPPPFV
jgi:CRISPR-associated protein (TIGR02710 family)